MLQGFFLRFTPAPRRVKEACVNFQETLLSERNAFVARNQATLIHSLEADSPPSQLGNARPFGNS